VPPAPPGDSVKATVPNPFARQTQFGVIVPGPTRLEVAILDIQGRMVRKIWSGEVAAAGTWNFSWDGRRDDGSRARPGLYFYRVMRPGRVESRRVVLLGR
jgi:flagellar hook assembly protein FlgD